MTWPGVDRALLMARTVRHLSPWQAMHRVRLRGQKVALAKAPRFITPLLRREVPLHPGWPDGYLTLDGRLAHGFPCPEANAEGRFRFLDRERSIGRDLGDWEQAGSEQLWRYHLHYFEWAWAFSAHPDRDWARAAFGRLWRAWSEHNPFGRWDAWSPYVVSLRSWVLCGVYRSLMAGGPDEARFLAQLGLHAGFVRANLELDVGGNHLVKNLKALMGLGVFLDDDRLVRLAGRHLERQLAIQVLADGGHFELSPSYHCQVLSDLLDVGELLELAGRPPVDGLVEAVEAMRQWLGTMLMPDGEVPLFNDCVPVGRERLKLLEPVRPPHRRLAVLGSSGYVVMRPDDRLHLVADVGPPCPPELPAHAHADCLSFELAVDGQRMVVDSGTSTYQPGLRRDHERSTAAHSTVEIDGQDQTEVWGTFRAARRAQPRLERAVERPEAIEVRASHNGYRRLPGAPLHRRSWRASPGRIDITDEVDSRNAHDLVARLQIAPGLAVVGLGDKGLEVGAVAIELRGGQVTVEDRFVASGFGRRAAAACVSVAAEGVSRHCFASAIVIRPEPR